MAKKNIPEEERTGAEDPASAPPIESPEAEVEALRHECEELQANWLRAQADYQNLRRRQLTDIDAAVRRAQAPFLENVLLVLDHLEMALATEAKSADAKVLMSGVKLTRDQLLQALEREEVRPIPTSGAFDPAVHQAVGTVQDGDHPPGTIAVVVRSGWSHRGQVLRPAQVKVAAAASRQELADSAPDGAARS